MAVRGIQYFRARFRKMFLLMIFLLTQVATIGGAEPTCTNDYTWVSSVSKCLRFIDTLNPYDGSVQSCTDAGGGELVSILNQDEFYDMSVHVQSTGIPAGTTNAWVGLEYYQSSMTWGWTDDTEFLPDNFQPPVPTNTAPGYQRGSMAVSGDLSMTAIMANNLATTPMNALCQCSACLVIGPDDELCDGVPYDPAIQLCCMGNIVSRAGGVSLCCGTAGYNPKKQVCCNGVVNPRTRGRGKKSYCCGTKVYNPGRQMCCDGTINQGRRSKNRCCGSVNYRRGKQLCCKGNVREGGSDRKCCGASSHSPRKQVCCKGTTGDRKDGQNCCGTQNYNPKNEKCCKGEVGSKDGGKIHCCGSVTYSASDHVCCRGNIHDNDTGKNCCGKQNYNRNTHKCVRGKVEERSGGR